MSDQASLFETPASLPEGLLYQNDFLSVDEERELIDHVRALPFSPMKFHGFTANRQTVSFGWSYDFGTREFAPAPRIPDFLLPLRARAAELAGVRPEELEQALVTAYPPGTSIGWHRDLPVFGLVIGVSLASSCQFRLRRKEGGKWQRVSWPAEPRSIYVLSGEARNAWEHSINPTAALRYSITFRTLRNKPAAKADAAESTRSLKRSAG